MADEVPIIVVRGEIDISNINQFREFLETSTDANLPGVVVDLSQANYFDSRTVATLADMCTRLRVARQRIAVVVDEGGFAAKVLRVAGLTFMIPTVTEVAEAVAAVKRPQ
jgi:anti-anti-sigma factor